MDYKALFAQIDQREASGAYYFHGEEEYVKRSALDKLKALFEPEELNVQVMTAPSAQDVIAACETMSFFGERRLVICREWAQKEEKALGDYLLSVPPTAVLLLYRIGKGDGRTGLLFAAKKCNRDVEFPPLDDVDAVRWVQQQALKEGAVIEPAVARHMVTLVGTQVNTLYQELKKAAAYAGEGMPITHEALTACVSANIEYRLFDTLDDLLGGRVEQGLRALYAMLEERTTRPTAAAALMAGQCKNLLSAKLLLEAGIRGEKEIAARLGCKPFVAQKSVRMAKAYTKERLMTALRAFADVDYRIKTGQAQERPALESAIFMALSSK